MNTLQDTGTQNSMKRTTWRLLRIFLTAVLLLLVGLVSVSSVPAANAQPDPELAACYLVGDGYENPASGDSSAQDTLLHADVDPFSRAAIPPTGTGHTGTFNIEAIEWDYNGATNSGTPLLYAADAGELGTINTSTGVYTDLSGNNRFTTNNDANRAVICERGGGTRLEQINDVDGLAYNILDGTWWGTDRNGGPDTLFRFVPTDTGQADGLIVRNQFTVGANTCDAVEIETVPDPEDPENEVLQGIDDMIYDPFSGELYGLANTGGGSVTVVVRIDRSNGDVTNLGIIKYPDSTATWLRDTEGFGNDETGRLFVSTGKDGDDAGTTGNRLFEIDRADLIGEGGAISATFVGNLENSRTDQWPVDFESATCFNIDEQPIAFLGDRVWDDTNANGIQNPGEPGVPGVTVRLYSDADGDPNTTFDQVLEDTVQTAFNGSYLFYVTPGVYYFVEFDAVGALTLAKQGGNDAEDSDADPATGRTAIITPLIDDEQFLDLDAGLIEQDVDWGDAADPSYPTLASSAGARHIISSALYLGACVDSEGNGLQSAAANGDDNNTGATTIGSCQTTGDDEDGVVFPAGLVAGQSASVEVTAAGSSSAGAILDAWCDWDQSGAWEPGEDFETIIGAGPIALSGGGTTDTLNFTVPPSSAAGTTNCRFRVSTGGGLNTQGLATNGEVEDHRVGIEVIAEDRDWADAPDPNYPTLSVPPDATPPDGASHLIGGDVSPFMGKCVDAEGDGQQSVGAVGDDTGASSTTIGSCAQANDDEDGVTIGTLTPGSTTATATIDMSASPADCKINAWIDFNIDGDWADPGEKILTDADAPDGATPVVLNFFVPGTAKAGQSYARFRCNSSGGLNVGGPASDGEVEDYQVTIGTADLTIDWGDAPSIYPTTSANGGANHIAGGAYLGSCVDGESNGLQTTNANGDDLNAGTGTVGACADPGDDEDGVVFLSPLVQGQQANIDVIASEACILSAFMDYNADGDWTDVGESLFPSGQALTAGNNNLNFIVPAGASLGVSYARFRCSTDGLLPPNGPASDGEVEDYGVLISPEPPEGDDPGQDFGDLPNSYGTLITSNGARHTPIGGGPRLGSAQDSEPNGAPNSTATGDDTANVADEDGVAATGNWTDGSGELLVTVGTAPGCLNIWVDFTNGSVLGPDGDFDDTHSTGESEHVYTNQAVAIGTDIPIAFPLPVGIADSASLPMRVRLTPQDSSGGCTPDEAYGGAAASDGPATGGEVEDYIVVLGPTAVELVTFAGSTDSSTGILFLLSTAVLLIGGSLFLLRRRKTAMG